MNSFEFEDGAPGAIVFAPILIPAIVILLIWICLPIAICVTAISIIDLIKNRKFRWVKHWCEFMDEF